MGESERERVSEWESEWASGSVSERVRECVSG